MHLAGSIFKPPLGCYLCAWSLKTILNHMDPLKGSLASHVLYAGVVFWSYTRLCKQSRQQTGQNARFLVWYNTCRTCLYLSIHILTLCVYTHIYTVCKCVYVCKHTYIAHIYRFSCLRLCIILNAYECKHKRITFSPHLSDVAFYIIYNSIYSI